MRRRNAYGPWRSNPTGRQSEADEIAPDDLSAAADVYDALRRGDFYERQEAAHAWLRAQGDGGATRRIVEQRPRPFDPSIYASAVQRSEAKGRFRRNARRNAGGYDTAKAAVRKHFRDLMDEDDEVKAARAFASYDLWHGPMTVDQMEAEDYPPDWDFEVAIGILRDWWDATGGEVWYDSQSGFVETSEPQGFEDDDGEWVEPIWEDYVHFESQDAKRAVFGELAEYL